MSELVLIEINGALQVMRSKTYNWFMLDQQYFGKTPYKKVTDSIKHPLLGILWGSSKYDYYKK